MNCEDVRKGNIVEKYVADELSEREREVFEEHYFSCPTCLEELATVQQIAGSVKELVETGEIAYKPEAVKESILQRWGRLGAFIPDPRPWRYLKPAFYALLVLILAMMYPTWRGLFLSPKSDLRANVSFFPLDVTRGENRLYVPRYSEAIILEFSIDVEEEYERYGAEIADYQGSVISREKDLRRLGDFGTFAIGFDRDFLKEGDYVLTVYGFKDNESLSLEKLPFQIVKSEVVHPREP